jgi:class 3 adenylate cyclase
MHWTLSSFRPIIRSDLWGPPMDVGAWLRGLGLGQYEGAFRDSKIEADTLPELTETDLEKLGLPLGSRKRILRALQNLGDADKSSAAANLARPIPAKDTAERRQLTVMFCDLVGSTAISARLDPEDLSSVIGAFQKACVSAVTAFGGSIAKYMGDGALVYFGYPTVRRRKDSTRRHVRLRKDWGVRQKCSGRFGAYGWEHIAAASTFAPTSFTGKSSACSSRQTIRNTWFKLIMRVARRW